MTKAIKRFWLCVIKKTFPEIEELQNFNNESIKILERMENTLQKEKEMLEKDVEFHKTLLETIGDTIPDMLWCKDVNGYYMYANKSIKENLLFDDNPIGKNDIHLSANAKKLFGVKNHTFGANCGNSDVIVKNNEKPQRFLESGKIKGKMVYLEVHKAPLIFDGKLVGTVGSGRDLTEYVEAYRNGCNKCDNKADIFAKYEFKE